MRKAWMGSLLGLSLLVQLCGSAAQAALPSRRATTTFAGHAIWFSGQRTYRPGLQRLQEVSSPWTYESVQLEQYGPSTLTYAKSAGRLSPDGNGLSFIRLDGLSSFTVNGERYSVPRAYAHWHIALLPLQDGVVWLVTPRQGPQNFVVPGAESDKPSLSAAGLHGATRIYYTPYLPNGGSLLHGRRTIAVLPHRWSGLDAPVAASAWTGWLPSGEVQVARSVVLLAHELSYGKMERLVGNRTVSSAPPGYPGLFLRRVGGLAPGQHPLIAWVGRMMRTATGFVLEVHFADENYGVGSSGLGAAEYFWSEASRKWTPLTQLFLDETIASFIDVGSGEVYWQHALVPPSGGSRLDLVQMSFDPKTLSIEPIWAGGYVYAQSFVDGATWVHDMPQLTHGDPALPATSVWSANTP
jgi:hypothetical protein